MTDKSQHQSNHQPADDSVGVDSGGRAHKAGALDIRNVIGALLGIYGAILTLMGLVGDQELDKTGDVNANLWAGLALLVTAAIFLAWARLRPLQVPG
ncbi:hypothetical protein [Nocardioides guangzhouensis]|uniref:hypothetical protein n=1 Tax=Nocardioides guangzhouensis TaxID=2497878 RepID=UPI001438302E